MTPEKPINPEQKCIPMPRQPAAPSSESSRSNNDTKGEEYVSYFPEWLGLDTGCKRILDDATKILVHHGRKILKIAEPIFPQAVNEDPEL